MKLALMHIFLQTHNDEDYKKFIQEFEEIKNHGAIELSISPMNEYGEFGEIYATLQFDENRHEELLNFMSDGWDGPLDDCQSVFFTAHIFSEYVNTLYFTILD